MESAFWRDAVLHSKPLVNAMKVTFFSNQFSDSRGHGLARYARQLFAALKRISDLEVTPVSAWTSMDPIARSELEKDSGLRLSPLGRRLTPLAWNYLDWPKIETLFHQTPDVVHATALGYPVATNRPYVVTIHDLGPLTHPQFFSNTRPWIMENALRHAERNAGAIVCVSRSTADEVATYLGAHIEPRLEVVHGGVSEEFFLDTESFDATSANPLPFDAPFILTVGKISPRKNVQNVIEALSLVKHEIPHHLVIVGGEGWDAEPVLKDIVGSEIVDRIHNLCYVDDDTLRQLYRKAALYVLPSFYEGFGLPILEAMASGTPVIAANASSLPEIAGNAAVLVDPASVEELAESMRSICLNDSEADRLRDAGYRRARNFSWRKCANDMHAVYSNLVAMEAR